MPDLFKDYVESILKSGFDHMTTSEDEVSYVPFIVNKALSFHLDTVLAANEMNMANHLPKRMQYAFLLNIVRKQKRTFQPWLKRKEIQNIDIIKEYYSVSYEKAKDILMLLTDEQVDEIIKRLYKGGMKNDKSKRPSMGEI